MILGFFLYVEYSSNNRKGNLLYWEMGLLEIILVESSQKLMFLAKEGSPHLWNFALDFFLNAFESQY